MEGFIKKLKLRTRIQRLVDRKHYLDFLLAILSIPVVLTVLYLNISNIQKSKTPTPSPTSGPTIAEKQIILETTTPSTNITLTQISSICKKEVGPISMSYPGEGDKITDNPVCINIKYSDTSYCSVVWSYRINNGSWSEYGSNSPCLYNMPSGDIKFELRVQSTTSNDQTTLQRNFKYQNNSTVPTPSPTTPAASSSANLP